MKFHTNVTWENKAFIGAALQPEIYENWKTADVTPALLQAGGSKELQASQPHLTP